MLENLPPLTKFEDINDDNNSNLNDPKKVFKQPDYEVKMDEKEQTPPIKRWKNKFNNYGQAINNFVEEQTNSEYRDDQLDYIKAGHKYQTQELNEKLKNAKTVDEKLVIEKQLIGLRRQQSDEIKRQKHKPTVDKSVGLLYKQSGKISIPINRPSAFKAGMFNKGFVRPYAGDSVGNFTLTKGNKMEVNTGGFDTQDEFKRNENVKIYVPQARTGGRLSSPGSLSVNMGVRETPMNMEIVHPMERSQPQYDIPSGMKNMVKNRAVGNSMSRNMMKNNMRSDMNMMPRPEEPSFWDDILVGSARVSQKQGVPLKQGVGQDRVNYGAMTNGVNGSTRRSVMRYNNGNGVSTIKSPEFKVKMKSLELKKPSIRTKHNHKSVLKPLEIKTPKISIYTLTKNSKKRK